MILAYDRKEGRKTGRQEEGKEGRNLLEGLKMNVRGKKSQRTKKGQARHQSNSFESRNEGLANSLFFREGSGTEMHLFSAFVLL